jgi:hypothetical protein
MRAAYTLGMDPDGREHLLVVVKGTFAFPTHGEPPQLAAEQVPLVEADTFTGEPGLSATVYESDYALRKPRCDVILLGSAHAPEGRPTDRVRVGLRVGSMQKFIDVVGDRTWESGVFGVRPSKPKPFTTMPITYDRAFGGVDDSKPEDVAPYSPNPVGVGFHKNRKPEEIAGLPVPNLEEPGRPITAPTGDHKPMSFGCIGRSWPSRIGFAGTYDEHWMENVFPFLPKDFDERYYQAAPSEQQIDHPHGGEPVHLLNLTPEGRTSGALPSFAVPVEFTSASWERETKTAVADTVQIEPDERRIVLVGRTSVPLPRNIFDMRQVVVGRMPKGWYRARDLGKTYYRDLGELVAARREEGP